ncbi:MAG: hypothetical protein M3P41_15985, partial [Actinomycetota bacterium]|nr:hypothetical protein [Actinomycetota bacterium]
MAEKSNQPESSPSTEGAQVSPYDVRRNHALKVIYVTAQLPYGPNEPFIIPEIIELGRQGISVTVVPTRPLGSLVHDDA